MACQAGDHGSCAVCLSPPGSHWITIISPVVMETGRERKGPRKGDNSGGSKADRNSLSGQRVGTMPVPQQERSAVTKWACTALRTQTTREESGSWFVNGPFLFFLWHLSISTTEVSMRHVASVAFHDRTFFYYISQLHGMTRSNSTQIEPKHWSTGTWYPTLRNSSPLILWKTTLRSSITWC
jgi:hypothetical protein